MKKLIVAGVISCVLMLGAASSATATGTSASASNWHVGIYNASGRALSQAQASASPSGVAAFQFTTTPDVALLTTSQGSQKGALLGDITGKTVTATYTITGTGPFSYYGQGTPSNPCGTPASVRLYFQTSNAGGFDPANYWWSNPGGSQVLQVSVNTVTVSAQVSPDQWSDWNGQAGTVALVGFVAAEAHVTDIGLSFGGGCFFENGVGAPDATFTLISYTVVS